MNNVVIHGDCIEVMKKIPDNSIDLIITSPPYNASKNYGTFNDNVTLEEWINMIRLFMRASYRVLSQGSKLCLNIPWVMLKKPQRFVAHIVASVGEEEGFYLRDWIIWDKGAAPSTAWGTWLSPSGPVIRARCEPIIIFQKGMGGKKRTSGEGHGKCVKGDCSSKEFLELTENVWKFCGVRQKNHPAMFPEELPKRLIKLYTWKNDIVLDPFAGSGTTLIAAKKLKRRFIGIEIDDKYCKMSKNRVYGLEKFVSENS